MECEKMQLFLPEYVKGLLGNDERLAVQRHIEECGVCREETKQIRQMLEDFSQARSTAETPAEESQNRYGTRFTREFARRDSIENHRASPRLRQLRLYPRSGILQLANVIIIVAAGTWFYFSYQSDSMKERENTLQIIIGKAMPESGKSAANTVLQNRDALMGAVARVASNPEIPLEKIQDFLDRQNEEGLYDSVTEFFADIVIRISEKS